MKRMATSANRRGGMVHAIKVQRCSVHADGFPLRQSFRERGLSPARAALVPALMFVMATKSKRDGLDELTTSHSAIDSSQQHNNIHIVVQSPSAAAHVLLTTPATSPHPSVRCDSSIFTSIAAAG